jgi:hypothetical protein
MFMVAGWMRGTVGENDGSDKINCCIPGKILLQRPTITRSPRVRSPIPDRVARYLPFTTGAFGVEWVSSPAIFIHGATVGQSETLEPARSLPQSRHSICTEQ